tara:strand:+ start:100 stop:672 length:573 start_codon:yes stop_codon:yes gene_type:complete
MAIRKNELYFFPTLVSVYDLSELNLNIISEVVENNPKDNYHLVEKGKTDFVLDKNILDHPNLIELKQNINSCVDDYRQRLGLSKVKIASSWSSITDVGGRLELHRHAGSTISGVFYPEIKQPISPLLFKDPTHSYKMCELYDRSIEPTINSFSYMKIDPSLGMLVLFPGWLEHKTDREIGRRKVISFNVV